MFDATKRKELDGPTVRDLIEALEELDPETKINICGCDSFYLHVSIDGDEACLDDEDLDYEYDED